MISSNLGQKNYFSPNLVLKRFEIVIPVSNLNLEIITIFDLHIVKIFSEKSCCEVINFVPCTGNNHSHENQLILTEYV